MRRSQNLWTTRSTFGIESWICMFDLFFWITIKIWNLGVFVTNVINLHVINYILSNSIEYRSSLKVIKKGTGTTTMPLVNVNFLHVLRTWWNVCQNCAHCSCECIYITCTRKYILFSSKWNAVPCLYFDSDNFGCVRYILLFSHLCFSFD